MTEETRLETEPAEEPPAGASLLLSFDGELAAMAELSRLLLQLDERSRARVLRWLQDRFGSWK